MDLFDILLLTHSVLLVVSRSTSFATESPHIILIVADDLVCTLLIKKKIKFRSVSYGASEQWCKWCSIVSLTFHQ